MKYPFHFMWCEVIGASILGIQQEITALDIHKNQCYGKIHKKIKNLLSSKFIEGHNLCKIYENWR